MPKITRINRKRLMLAGVAALLAVPVLQTPASADILDDGFVIIDTTLPGANSCTITANVPTVSAKVITGTGSVECVDQQAVITLTICIEASTDGSANSFVEVSCSPPKERQNARRIEHHSHQIPCGPTPMYYRTRAAGVAYEANGDMTFNGTAWSGKKIFGCPLV
ncbi:MAG TPA: hypothetical protein VEU29_04855 [Actinomycetota bacterium]|nr:hypothetical protein [Actinomycetota bacterium]